MGAPPLSPSAYSSWVMASSPMILIICTLILPKIYPSLHISVEFHIWVPNCLLDMSLQLSQTAQRWTHHLSLPSHFFLYYLFISINISDTCHSKAAPWHFLMAHLLPSPSISYPGFKSIPVPHTHNVHSHLGYGLLSSPPALPLFQNVLHHAASLIFLKRNPNLSLISSKCISFLHWSLSEEPRLDHDLKAAHVDLYQLAQPHFSSCSSFHSCSPLPAPVLSTYLDSIPHLAWPATAHPSECNLKSFPEKPFP